MDSVHVPLHPTTTCDSSLLNGVMSRYVYSFKHAKAIESLCKDCRRGSKQEPKIVQFAHLLPISAPKRQWGSVCHGTLQKPSTPGWAAKGKDLCFGHDYMAPTAYIRLITRFAVGADQFYEEQDLWTEFHKCPQKESSMFLWIEVHQQFKIFQSKGLATTRRSCTWIHGNWGTMPAKAASARFY